MSKGTSGVRDFSSTSSAPESLTHSKSVSLIKCQDGHRRRAPNSCHSQRQSSTDAGTTTGDGTCPLVQGTHSHLAMYFLATRTLPAWLPPRAATHAT